MGRYTGLLEDTSFDLVDDGWNRENLEEAVKLFRPFDVALTTYMREIGLVGDDATSEDIIETVTQCCKREGIKPPRSIKNWFSEHKGIEKNTAFDLCFAFGLDITQSMDFLRRICLIRGFDKHDMKDIAYYFSIREGLGYSVAQDIISRIDAVKTDKKIDDEQVVYTQTIASDIDEIHSLDELVDYLTENRDRFGYNNATAIRFIRALWDEISSEEGLAEKERSRYNTSELRIHENISDNNKKRGVNIKKGDSLWEIYLQILGLSGIDMSKVGTDRSIKPLLENTDYVHKLAEDSFPDRDGLNKILRGEHVSPERIRKLLILLSFYTYWVKLLLKTGTHTVKGVDYSRCEKTINNYLVDAGYHTLYIGNPYDWLILYALLGSDEPLRTFREFMVEMYYQIEL